MNIGAGMAVIVSLIAAIVFVGFDAGSNADYIFAANTATTAKSRVAADLSRLRDQEKLAGPILVNLLNRVPQKDTLSISFPGYVRSLGQKYNASSSSKFGEEKREANFNSIKFNIMVQGDYSSAVSFLNEFEKAPYMINIASFSIIRQSEKYVLAIDGDVMFRD